MELTVTPILNLVLPIVAVMIPAAIVSSRVNGRARVLMWTGATLVSVAQIPAYVLLFVVDHDVFSHELFGMFSWAGALAFLAGVVLLVVAIGAASAGGEQPISRYRQSYPAAPGAPTHETPR